MSDYDKVHNFAAKDAINAPVVGTEFQDEFDAIQEAVNSKANSFNAELTGLPQAPTPTGGIPNQIINVQYVSNGAASIDAASLRSRNQVIAKTGSQSPNNTNNAGFVFSGDSDSGLFNPTDGRIVLATNGSNKFEINSSQVRVKDDLVAEQAVFLSTGQLTLQGTGRIQGVDTVSASTDAANKAYVDGRVNPVESTANATRSAILNVNQVGSLVFARWNKQAPTTGSSSNRTITINYGGTVPGSELSPANDDNTSSSTLSGTWRCLGFARNTGDRDSEGDDIRTFAKTLFVRIS